LGNAVLYQPVPSTMPVLPISRRNKMKYRVSVVMSYWQTIDVEAESCDDARSIALDAFDISKAVIGDGETHSVEQLEGESK
jgi:hypothetical protein